ncbi:hypothetical protein [Consotaella aegiceratis]|uniref:hypothetical protein n=1 Tax=Consotaella aegiceratis TaxID=3097961 RepID=UPI002F416455
MPNVTDDERLIVLVEARIRDLERNMAKASATTGREFNKIRRSSKSATAAMEADIVRSTTRINQALAGVSTRIGALSSATGTAAFGSIKAGALGVLAPILGVSAAIGKAKEAMADFDKIAKTAKATGLDGEFYQEFAFGAGLAGVSVGELDSALLMFIKNSAQAANNQGTLYSQLKKSNPELLKAIQNAQSQQERLRLVADAIDKASSSTEKANIATAAFGRNGAKMVNVFNGGSAALDRTAAKARELGLVVDNELLASAEDMNDEFSIATQVLDLQFKKALIGLMPGLTDAARGAGDFAKQINAISEAIDSMPVLPDFSGWAAHFGQDVLGLPDLSQTDLAKALGAKSVGEARIGKQFDRTSGSGSGNAEQDQAIAAYFGMQGEDGSTTLPTVTVTSTAPHASSSTRSSRARSALGRGAAALNDYQREIKSIQERTAALQAETTAQAGINPLIDDYGFTLEKAKAKQDLLNAAHEAGVHVTPEVEANIEKLAGAYASASAAADKLAKSQDKARQSAEDMANLEKDALKGFISDLNSGTAPADAFANAIQKIADKLLDELLDSILQVNNAGGGGGLFSQIFGSLFGGGISSGTSAAVAANPGAGLFDKGGYTGAGGKHEPAGIVHRGEYVIDADTTRRIGVANLDALRGYADGGLVGGNRSYAPVSSRAAATTATTKAPNVTLQISNQGNPIQADDVQQTSDADGNVDIEAVVRQIARDEVTRKGTPTNRILKRGGFRMPLRNG